MCDAGTLLPDFSACATTSPMSTPHAESAFPQSFSDRHRSHNTFIMSPNRTDQADIVLEPILQSHLEPPSYSSAPASTTTPSRRNSQDQLLGSTDHQNESHDENSDPKVPLGKRELVGMPQTVGQVVKLWAFEVLALIAAVLVLVGLVLLLLEFDGIRQPEWPEWINLSTIVSMFSTTLRTLLAVVIASGSCPANDLC